MYPKKFFSFLYHKLITFSHKAKSLEKVLVLKGSHQIFYSCIFNMLLLRKVVRGLIEKEEKVVVGRDREEER
jgi:hypothetical protein